MLLTAVVTSVPEPGHPADDPRSEIRATRASSTTRVLVELRVSTGGDAGAAIAAAQREVIARLAGTQAIVVRQYRSVPMLALEVDMEALMRLEQMGDLVVRVVPDTPARTQGGR